MVVRLQFRQPSGTEPHYNYNQKKVSQANAWPFSLLYTFQAFDYDLRDCQAQEELADATVENVIADSGQQTKRSRSWCDAWE